MSEWAFDPRVGDAVWTSNPAVIAALMLADSPLQVDWRSVAEMADWYDEPVSEWIEE